MAKRTASSDLNHDNWDKQEDPEDAGTFKKASDEAIKNRIIKVAKRRNPISSVQVSTSAKLLWKKVTLFML
jgi:nuclear pore complex protein Nup50